MTESSDCKKAQRNFFRFGKYLYLDCNDNYTVINICQNSSNCTFELNFIICKLYGNKFFLHLKIINKYGKTLEMPLGLKVTCDERYLTQCFISRACCFGQIGKYSKPFLRAVHLIPPAKALQAANVFTNHCSCVDFLSLRKSSCAMRE